MTVAITPEPLEGVVRADVAGQVIVTAGAGVGKTEVLCERIRLLVDEQVLGPRELLVISFTRAAVAEIADRLREASSRARAVRPSTFDALATRILSELDPAGDWLQLGFDQRIVAASETLGGDHGLDSLNDIRHVMVDECQDLVGVRADFILRLLDRLDVGYTVFGDPAQSIYGFAASDGEPSFFARLRRGGDEPAREFHAEGNRRARSDEARAALWAGPTLAQETFDAHDTRERLLDVVRTCPSLGALDDAACMLASTRTSTGVLCRTNGEALLVAERLSVAGAPYALQRAAEDRPLEAWLGQTLRGWNRPTLGERDFRSRFAELGVEADACAAWGALLSLARIDAAAIDIDRMRRRLRIGRAPDELVVDPGEQLIVSSVHRSKGLEYDRVVILEPESKLRDDRDIAEETRVLYVALTRARDEILTLGRPSEGWRLRQDRGRWLLKGARGKGTSAIEMLPEDVDALALDVLSGRTPAEVQTTLGAVGKGAKPVSLELAARQEKALTPTYLIVAEHLGRIGVTSGGFGEYLARVVGSHPSGWPTELHGAEIECVETVLGPPLECEAAGLGSSGLWLAPRLRGLARMRWAGGGRAR